MLLVLRVLRWLVSHLPVWAGRWLAMRAGDVAYYFAHRGRRAAISNMRHVLGPDASWSQVRRAAHKVFQNVGLDYYDMLRVSDLSDERLRREVIFDEVGFRPVRRYIEEHQAMIMVSAHYGSVDMAGRVLQAYGWKVAMLADQVGGSRLFQFTKWARERSGAEMLAHEEGAGMLRRVIQTLRAGRTVGMLVDRNAEVEEHSGVRVPFFGQEIIMTTALARLALRTKAQIVPAFCYREGRKYVIRIHPPIAPDATGEQERDVATLMRKVAAIYEQHIRRHPDQWLLLSPVWPDGIAELASGA